MSEHNKSLVRRVFEEVWTKGNLALVDELYDPSYVLHDPAHPEFKGTEGLKKQVTMYLTAFPDLRFTIQDQRAEEDEVVTRWTASGTHRGPLGGIPPTGKQATTSGITVTRIAGGKIAEAWTNWDILGLMRQLGVPLGLSKQKDRR